MVWVRSEYAGELAVLSTWLNVLIPWNVSYSPDVAGGSLLFVRFVFLQVRYAFGVPFARAIQIQGPLAATRFQAGQSIEAAYQVWTAGAALFGVAVLLSVAYYLREERVAAGPVDPVRLLGGLLGATGVVLAASTALLVVTGFPGLSVPVGVVFLLVLGGVLLRVERS